MRFFILIVLGMAAAAVAVTATAADLARYPKLAELAEVMVRDDGYPRAELEQVLAAAAIDPSVIRAMDRQYEALPWHQYRARFITEARIAGGAGFWHANAAALNRAADQYGVPASVITALLGVETNYGETTGAHRVLDSLVTLTADYPRRSAYFGRELRAFLNAARAEGIDPGQVTGSFAGAAGIPQFMPTSYQAYAVDFNANGRRDLSGEVEDAIGSVGNYLKQHGWRAGQRVFARAAAPLPTAAAELVTQHAKPTVTAEQLLAAGVKFDPAGGSVKMALLNFQGEAGAFPVVAFRNFYAITRYNTSVNYALAVAELSQAIRARRGQ